MPPAKPFASGVIEGFYGPPWNQAERTQLFAWMKEWGLNTYFYGPKDDLKHRAIWREPYTANELAALRELISQCEGAGFEFVYALSPGLDVQYSKPEDFESIIRRFETLQSLGARGFCLLFDDIPDRMHPEDAARWPSLAAAQAELTNRAYAWTRQHGINGRFLFCPTPYCGRMARRRHGGAGYLETIGAQLDPDIGVFWTGPEIISHEISLAHVREVRQALRRKPILWDNFFANDYDGRRLYLGPYTGRSVELLQEVDGILCNPNNEFPLNYPGLRTYAEFLQARGAWDARASHERAIQAWTPEFETVRGAMSTTEVQLLADAFYWPHSEGPSAETLYESARALLAVPPEAWGDDAEAFCSAAQRLREVCARIAELRNRPLFYALSRRVWELREELDLLENSIRRRRDPAQRSQPWASDFHLPRLYRGGLTARLQRLIRQNPDGTFAAAVTPEPQLSPTHDALND